MSDQTKIFYLPIRAFGDFLITASVVKGRFKERIPVLLPDFIYELYQAIGAEEYFKIAKLIHFNNQPIFFQLYTLTKWKNIYQLLTDLKTVNAAVNRKDIYLLDYSSRRLFFTNAHMIWPDKNVNIYEGKAKIFSSFFEENVNYSLQPVRLEKLGKNAKVLILPDSRIEVKRIGPALIKTIQESFSDRTINVAYYSDNSAIGDQIFYTNFQQLITLIKAYDFIIAAESLPYHLAYYLRKPHFVIYYESRHLKQTFMTPFMVQHNSYSIAEKNKEETVLEDLKGFLN